MFLGGVQNFGLSSDLPGLIGCFRGLKIGDHVYDFDDDASWTYGVGVQRGCSSVCEGEKDICKNEGICINGFQTNDPQHCDCSATSFFGSDCSQETSYHFNERDSIALTNHKLNFTDWFHIKLAFSNLEVNEEVIDPQLIFKTSLLDVNLNNTIVILFFLKEDLDLLIVFERFDSQQRTSSVSTLDQNVSRHSISLSFLNGNISLTIDKIEMTNLETNSGEFDEHLFPDFDLLIGGSPGDFTSSFSGCISNILLKSVLMEFKPLDSYKLGKEFERHGLPKLGNCRVTHKTRGGPVFYDFSSIPAWKSQPPQKLSYVPPSKEENNLSEVWSTTQSIAEVTTITTSSPPSPNSAKIWPWALVGCLVFFLCVILLVCCIRKCKKKKTLIECDIESKLPSASTVPEKSPSYTLQPPFMEAIPLLEREPSIIRGQRKHSNSRGLKNDIQELNQRKFNPIKDDPVVVEVSLEDQVSLNSSATNLNSIDKDATSDIPFINQLSSNLNNLHFIDSSTDESSEEYEAALEYPVKYSSSFQEENPISMPLGSPKLLNSQEKLFEPLEPSEGKSNPELSKFSVTNLKESSNKRPNYKNDFSISGGLTGNNQIPLGNIEEESKELLQSETNENFHKDDQEQEDLLSSDDNSEDEQDLAPKSNPIDMKTYFLRRKASKPPKLPPKSK